MILPIYSLKNVLIFVVIIITFGRCTHQDINPGNLQAISVRVTFGERKTSETLKINSKAITRPCECWIILHPATLISQTKRCYSLTALSLITMAAVQSSYILSSTSSDLHTKDTPGQVYGVKQSSFHSCSFIERVINSVLSKTVTFWHKLQRGCFLKK